MPAGTAEISRLAGRSVEVIRAGQAETGAYLACPAFPPYRYCWFRDGAFVAEAMSRAGEVDSAAAFFHWGADVVLARRGDVEAGGDLETRYTVDGNESRDEEWRSFQLDGFGLFLWALARHEERHSRADGRVAEAAGVLRAYLARSWRRECTDWWEERDGLHATTLACIAAGLRAAGDPEAERVVEALRAEADWRLDASLLAVATPLGVLGPEAVPLCAIEDELVSPGGGVHRHPADTYYGGGEWLLLTGLLGWHYLELGRTDDARAKLDWVAAHAAPAGELPEQSQDHLLAPDRFEPWVARWGPPPSPLLWSHAMFLLLAHALEEPA
jgi:GH15 family glucan-1,4-alpha-glucosidase